jgi:hypothetical protein
MKIGQTKDLDVWFKIISTYRYLIKGSKDELKEFDLCIQQSVKDRASQ